MTLSNVILTCSHPINKHIWRSLVILCALLCTHQGSSTVVPIGSCILIYSEACPRSEIQFYLFTRRNPNTSELVYFSDVYDNVTSSSFNSSLPNKIIVHGYNTDMNLDILQNIKSAYLRRGDYNVWFVNWPDLCRGPCYVISVYNIEQVGKCVAQMINRLKKYIGSNEPELHLIGFSLGAHVAAYTAKHLRPYKLSRVTGLDPAMPMFAGRDRDSRLDAEDAKFVDVIHTSAFVQGQYERCGHVDFYMNGGIEQPGCWNASNIFDCNHRRAPEYFAESINSAVGFWGWPCSGMMNYILDMCPLKSPTKLMGEECVQSSRGFYIVPTHAVSPFAKGPLKPPNSSKPSSTTSSENTITIPSREKKNKSAKQVYNSARSGKSRKLESGPSEKTSLPTTSKTFEEISNEIATTTALDTTTSATSTTPVTSSTSTGSTTSTADSAIDIEDTFSNSHEENAESTDSRFINLDTEIEFSEDIETTSTSSTPRTTTQTSKYRFIYRVPKPKKHSSKSSEG